MCWAMDTGLQNQEGVQENYLRKKLAVAVRSIQWSYAIFWSTSTRQQGVLEWGDGYYNGDVKTMKTVQPMELNADQKGLQRSEQLRELYESLSTSDTNQQTRRPSAALSPEDLTDAEWYYLVCMSFTFKPGQGLPGRALGNGQHIWLSSAHCADTKVFSRSLLAKSASIKTVVCFPFLCGVIELGATELVLEDLKLLHHIKTAFLEFSKPICSEESSSSPPNVDKDEDPVNAAPPHQVVDNMALERRTSVAGCELQPDGGTQAFPVSLPSYMPKEVEFDQHRIAELRADVYDEVKTGSPHDSSNGCGPNQHTADSFKLESINDGAAQVEGWQLMDDEFSNCVHGSMNSSDCISQTFLNAEKAVSSLKREKVNNPCLQDIQQCSHTKLSSLEPRNDDLHYPRTLSAILKNSNPLIVAPCFRSSNLGPTFASWKKGGLVDGQKPQIGTPQKMLKKILFKVAGMHGGCSLKSREECTGKDRLRKSEGVDIGLSHVLLERKRREKLTQKFLVLRSLVPSISKFDKVSILGNTIEYLNELERRVEELESCRELAEFEARGRRKNPDMVERTSDNYGNNDIANKKKPLLNKRKACNIDETVSELNWVLSKDGLAADVTVSIIDKEVLIEMQCPWRECLLLNIMDAISNLHLDAHSVQSSTTDGILTLTLKSKFRGAGAASAGIIKQALQGIISI